MTKELLARASWIQPLLLVFSYSLLNSWLRAYPLVRTAWYWLAGIGVCSGLVCGLIALSALRRTDDGSFLAQAAIGAGTNALILLCVVIAWFAL